MEVYLDNFIIWTQPLFAVMRDYILVFSVTYQKKPRVYWLWPLFTISDIANHIKRWLRYLATFYAAPGPLVQFHSKRVAETESERSEICFRGRGSNYFTAWECDDLSSISWINQTIGNRGYFEANKTPILLLFAAKNCTYMKTIFECTLASPVNQKQTVTQEQMRIISTKLYHTGVDRG